MVAQCAVIEALVVAVVVTGIIFSYTTCDMYLSVAGTLSWLKLIRIMHIGLYYETKLRKCTAYIFQFVSVS